MKIKQEIKKWKNSVRLSLALAIFFVLPQIHDWANNFVIKLHFCNHLYCMIFAAVFVIFAYLSYDKKKSYIKTIGIILAIGLILMYLAVCDADGNMSIAGFSLGEFSMFESEPADSCKPGVDCPGDIVEVPIPPCVETDDGRDYITFGSILSGSDLDDLCMGDILRERYCYDELTYTSEDINCKTQYGSLWTCEEGECRIGIAPAPDVGDGDEDKENTLALCTDELDNDGDFAIDCADEDCEAFCEGLHCGDGEDNDLDGDIDCADSDCDYAWLEGGCGDFEYSCQHNPSNPYPFCGGTCPPGEECIDYPTDGEGWCECMPEEEELCGTGFKTCWGWCLERDRCSSSCAGGCCCIFDLAFTCSETDGGNGPWEGGSCTDDFGTYLDYCGEDTDYIYEYLCSYEAAGCITIPYDCSLSGEECYESPEGAYCGGLE